MNNYLFEHQVKMQCIYHVYCGLFNKVSTQSCNFLVGINYQYVNMIKTIWCVKNKYLNVIPNLSILLESVVVGPHCLPMNEFLKECWCKIKYA